VLEQKLVEAASRARKRAHAPYSGLSVGCALEDEEGRVYVGCNVENASFSLTVCAERVALLKAVSEGSRRFSRMAVVAQEPLYPCGACLQALSEFCSGDFEIISASADGRSHRRSLLSHLLAEPFTAGDLEAAGPDK